MKLENHETCRGVMLSHVEAMIKIWESLGQVTMSDAQNPDISTCDHMRLCFFKLLVIYLC
jgi:hypothetical protein